MKNIINKSRLTILGALLIGIVVGLVFARLFSQSSREENVAHDHNDQKEYTCSMHPQIRQMEPGKCPLCGMDLTPVGRKSGSGQERNLYQLEMTEEAMALANIQTTKVKGGAQNPFISLSGKIQANQERMSTLTAKYSGRIESLYIGFEGQEIKKGQKIATIYAPDLATAHIELQEAAAQKESYPALYEAVVKKLKLWKLTDAQIEALESNPNFSYQFDIYSDSEGIVSERFIKVGDYVSTGSQLAILVDLKSVWVVLEAYENDLSELKVGRKVEFNVNGIVGKKFETLISHINPTMGQDSRTVEVRGIVSNPSYQLKPEMIVQAKVEGVATKGSLRVPRTAVLWTGTRSLVYVQVGKKPVFEMREITIGQRTGDDIVVLEGLEEGEMVVTNGVFAIDAAAQLNGNYSMMMPAEQSSSIQVDDQFSKHLRGIYEEYLKLSESLVQSDQKSAAKNLTIFQKQIVDASSPTKEVAEKWKPLQQSLLKFVKQMVQAKDLAAQRSAFVHVSDEVLELLENFGSQKVELYKAFCPMAEDDQGAYWVSNKPEIANPYFGEMMLTCGEIVKSFKNSPQPKTQNQGHQH